MNKSPYTRTENRKIVYREKLLSVQFSIWVWRAFSLDSFFCLISSYSFCVFFFASFIVCCVLSFGSHSVAASNRPFVHSFAQQNIAATNSFATYTKASTQFDDLFRRILADELRRAETNQKKMNIFYAIFFCVCCSLLCSITFNWTNKTMENADVCELCMLLLVLLLGVIWKWLFALPKGRLCRRNRQWLCSVSFRFIVCSAQHLFALSRFQHSRTKNIISVVRERVCKRARLCSVWTCIKMQ